MRSQQGQVLLIIIMLMATVLAVTFSVSFTSQTETQTAKLEEDSKRALAAAQAILEASLKQPASGTPYSITALGLTNLSGFTGSSTVLETTGNVFITPLLQKDEQYTFYLSAYPALTSYSSLSIDLYLNSEAACPNGAAIELTYINSDSSLTRSLIDPCDRVTKTAGSYLATTGGDTINGIAFKHKTNTSISISNKKLVFIRALFSSTKIGIKGVPDSSNLPSQGKITTAQAQTNTSVASTVSLFQSYPQIPSDFFVTSF